MLRPMKKKKAFAVVQIVVLNAWQLKHCDWLEAAEVLIGVTNP